MDEEKKQDNIEAYKYQLKMWRKLIKYLPPTDCDRDDVLEIEKLIKAGLDKLNGGQPIPIFQTIGPCPDPEQRVKDLYQVNTAAGWAKGQLKILFDMLDDHGRPEYWYLKEIKRIHNGLKTVSEIEGRRVKPCDATQENKPTGNWWCCSAEFGEHDKDCQNYRGDGKE